MYNISNRNKTGGFELKRFLGIAFFVGSVVLASPLNKLSSGASSFADRAARVCFCGSFVVLDRYFKTCAPSRISYFPASLATVSALSMSALVSGRLLSRPSGLNLPLKTPICVLYDDKH